MCGCCAETGQNFSDALLHVQRGGYTLHAQDQKGCLQGCPACFKARQLLLWPDNTPLLSSSAFLSKDAVQRCWQNYKLQLPEAEVQPALKGQAQHICLEHCLLAMLRPCSAIYVL